MNLNKIRKLIYSDTDSFIYEIKEAVGIIPVHPEPRERKFS